MGYMAAFRGTGGDDAENEIWRELGHDFFWGYLICILWSYNIELCGSALTLIVPSSTR